jgi:Sulfotransferase family
MATDAQTRGGRLPDFLGVGPPRAATSWLDAVLRGHVGLPRGIKEVDFFIENYARGIDWYMSYFRECDPSLPVGEICPSYYSPIGRERIALHIPRCRIICTFRDPVEWRYSFYKLALRNAWTGDDFETWVAKNPVNTNSGLKAWFETFGRDRVLVLIHDDLETDRQGFLDRVCSFIGIAPIAITESAVGEKRVNTFNGRPRNRRLARRARKLRDWLKGREAYGAINLLGRAGLWRYCFEGGEGFAPLDLDLQARLRERFRPEVEELEQLIGRNLSRWKNAGISSESTVCANSARGETR